MMGKLKRLERRALELLFPHDLSCAVCKTEQLVERGSGLCHSCRQRLQPAPQFKDLAEGGVTEARAGYLYHTPIKELIHRLKFRNERYLAKNLAWMLYDALGGYLNEGDILIPVPLHPKRLKERGYNQTELICGELCALSGARVLHGALIRTKYTTPQMELGLSERQRNVEAAFEAEGDAASGLRVIVVDDVITTGATVANCARALIQAGAARVDAVAVCATGGGGEA